MEKQMNALDIAREIKQGTFTADELELLTQSLRFARAENGRDTIRKLMVGDKVKFNGRRNRVVKGTVTKIKIKNVVVKDDNSHSSWNVPAQMLELA